MASKPEMKLHFELLILAHWSIQPAHEIIHIIKAGRVPRAGHQNPGQPEQLGKRQDMLDRIRLDGKVAVVTGAAGHIGAATMRLLAERGARIVAVDRKRDDLNAAIKDLPHAAEALAVAADVTEEDEVASYVRACLDRFGTIDVFYNNAGIEGDVKPITEYSLESFRRVLDVNVVGVFLGMKHVLPVMLKNDSGSIINTASIAGLVGSPHIAVYSASKHAVIGLTKSAAWECTATRVRVNCVCPGLIDSRMLSAIIQGRTSGNAPTPNDKIVERIPARRLGHASEVASIVAFLASDEASYVSGSAYTVDGGRTAA
jgi:NAD(P)-dependent dehydrogenase (short-subunit alcohol dehydrogenase family)